MRTLLTILCLAILPAAQGDELGRLFFTPAQRTELNYGTLQGGDTESGSSSLTVNGIVQRHGGSRTAWINGIPRSAGQSDEQNPDSLPVTMPNQSHSVSVKVGQKINVNPSADTQH